MSLISLLTLGLLWLVNAQVAELERLTVTVKCPNDSEFQVQHDLRDTYMLLTASSPVQSGYSYTMKAHSRDNMLLRVDIIKWNPSGRAEAHYDISDLKQPIVNAATKQIVAALETGAPDIFFFLNEMRTEGLRRTTRVRQHLPATIRKLIPALPTVYERVIYSALNPHFGKIVQRLPKHFELFPKSLQDWQKKYQDHKETKKTVKRAFRFDFSGHDQFGRPTTMKTEFGAEGMMMDVEAHLPSVIDLYNDDSYL